LLSPKGVFYLVAVQKNDIQSIARRMLDDYELTCEVVLERRAGIEHLFILKFQHQEIGRATAETTD